MRVLRGAAVHLLDGSAVTSKQAALDGLAAALGFPDWFGRNLDALFDCLADLSWLPPGEHVLVWSHHDRLRQADPAAYRAILAAFDEAPPSRLTAVLADA